MRALIFAFAVSLAFAASAQAAPVWRNTAGIGLGAAAHIELVRDGCGRGWHRDRWRDRSGDWHRVTVSRVGVPGCLDRRLEPSLPRSARGTASVGLGLSIATEMWAAPPPTHDPARHHGVKTATARAVDAIEAAETIFGSEMGVTLDLSPGAKTALIVTISAAIQAAVAEEMRRLTRVL